MTSIEWTDKTWNPTRGCSKVSTACDHCYAMGQAHRFSGPGKPYEGLTKLVKGKGPQWTGEVRTVPEKLDDPLRWRKPCRVFVDSMSDLFHPDVPDDFIDRVFTVMALCPQHSFQLLTKRPERMQVYLNHTETSARIFLQARHYGAGPASFPLHPFPNVWLGTSVENQETADERIPHLLQTPAAVRWLSMEPLLGPVELYEQIKRVASPTYPTFLDWIVLGGESGPRARPMHPEWVRSIRDQCQASNIPFFFKQWGAWKPIKKVEYGWEVADRRSNEDWLNLNGGCRQDGTHVYLVRRVGKKAAGRELDGRTWDEYPKEAS